MSFPRRGPPRFNLRGGTGLLTVSGYPGDVAFSALGCNALDMVGVLLRTGGRVYVYIDL